MGIEFWELTRYGVKHFSNCAEKTISSQSDLTIKILFVFSLLSNASNVRLRKLLAKADSIRSNIVAKCVNDLSERSGELLEIDVIHDLQEDLEDVAEPRSAEILHDLMV